MNGIQGLSTLPNEDNLPSTSSALLPPPLLDPNRKPLKRVDLREDNRCFLLYNLLSPKECEYFIEFAEKVGLETLHTSKSYRNHTRYVAMGPELSSFMWDRFKDLVEDIFVEEDDYKQIGEGHRLEGHWKPVGLNPCWRLSKYLPGPHFDGPFVQDTNNRSLKTLNIYLNGDFEGGTTNLVEEGQMLYKDEKTGIFQAREENILFKIKPEAGMALIFNHHILHEGEALKTNHKYLLRSDIMYHRVNAPSFQPHELKALELISQAEKLEGDGEHMEATKYYRRAYKLWPELEK